MTAPNIPEPAPGTLDADLAQHVAGWSNRVDGSSDDRAPLPPHHSKCLGCGPDNPHGHHLEVIRDGDGLLTRHVFDARHTGAPGIAHGGAVATVIDDLFGFMLYLVREPGVTRHLSVDYLAPVLLDTPYKLRARFDRREGRKLFVSAEGTNEAGNVVVTAEALFIVVGLTHFKDVSGQSSPPVAP